MIKMLLNDGQACPIFNCDICEDMIGDISEGIAVYTCPGNASANMKIDVLHVHKNTCQEIAGKTMNACDLQPLGAHLYFICANTALDVKQFDQLKRIHGAVQNSS